MPVETGFYPKATTPEPMNLLGMAGQFAGMQNQLNQNKLFSQQFEARKAIGPILQGAIDPQTGKMDWDKALLGVAANPQTSFMAPDIFEQGIRSQNLQADTALKSLQAAQVHYDALGKAAGSLLPLGNKVTQKDVIGQVGMLMGQGLIERDKAIDYISALPQDGAPLAQLVQQQAMQASGAAKALDMSYGAINTIGHGGGTSIVAASPLTGARQMGEVVNTPTPGELNTPVMGQTPGGAPTIAPRAAVVPQFTGSGEVMPGTGPQSGVKPAVIGPNATTSKYQEALGPIAAQDEDDLNARVRTGVMMAQNLGVAKEALGKFKTGGGAELGLRLSGIAQAMGLPTSVVDKLASGDRSAAQEFQKLAVQQAVANLRQAQGSGQRQTNLEFDNFVKSNPNLETDPRAIEKIFNLYTRQNKLFTAEQTARNMWKEGTATGEGDWKGKDMSQFPQWWQKHLLDKGVIKLNEESGYSMGVKGAD